MAGHFVKKKRERKVWVCEWEQRRVCCHFEKGRELAERERKKKQRKGKKKRRGVGLSSLLFCYLFF